MSTWRSALRTPLEKVASWTQKVRRQVTYSNVVASVALFVALGGTSYALLRVGSDDVVNNSLRSADVRDNSLRSRDVRDRSLKARDLRRNSLGGGAIREATLQPVPEAMTARRLDGAAAQELRVRCPADTVAKAGVCIEATPRSPDGFFGATNRCDNAGRGLVTYAQLERFAVTSALPQAEWTSSVYRNPTNGPSAPEQLEAVLVSGGGDVAFERVNLAVQHAFRCVALPSN